MEHPVHYLFIVTVFICLTCSNNNADKNLSQNKSLTISTESTTHNQTAKVTFVELGSVKCIPCKMMQPVMKTIESEFGDQINVVFYDVWEDPVPGKKYGIKLIPTQVFLDENNNEFFRHEGYFPIEDIKKLLVERGLAIVKTAEIDE
ncbi:thioredoxin family protein [candidate division KSB1 bacterium]|nr:thioredoxin family protein [candidate division KSB1 bacterium]